MSRVFRPLPIRMCVVVQLEDGQWQGYCIACHWQPRASKTKPAAERKASRHTCPRSYAEDR